MNFSKHAKLLITTAIAGLSILVIPSVVSGVMGSNCDVQKSIWCIAPRISMQLVPLENATVPKIATPVWMEPATTPAVRELTYSVSSRGRETIDLSEFKVVVRDTLADPRGWSRLGVSFRQVDSGGEFVFFATEPSQMSSFDGEHCNGAVSCTSGKAIAISQNSWQKMPSHFVKAKLNLRAYQETLINHELGHFLGHGHRECSIDQAPAPIMMPQTTTFGKCSPNQWPTPEELYAPSLGIRS